MTLSDLTVRQAKAADKAYNLPDTDGLGLVVAPTGGKSWHLRYYWLGKQKRISLGNYPEIGLREARALRDEARALLAKGYPFELLVLGGDGFMLQTLHAMLDRGRIIPAYGLNLGTVGFLMNRNRNPETLLKRIAKAKPHHIAPLRMEAETQIQDGSYLGCSRRHLPL